MLDQQDTAQSQETPEAEFQEALQLLPELVDTTPLAEVLQEKSPDAAQSKALIVSLMKLLLQQTHSEVSIM